MLAATIVHPKTVGLGFVGQIVVGQDAIYATGGTYHAPTLLCSTDRGGSFARWSTPVTSGLRGLHVIDGAVWIVGEYATAAVTRNRGGTWTKLALPKTSGTSCLYCINRDLAGKVWITGDEGLVLRTKSAVGRTFAAIPTMTTGRMLCLWFDTRDSTPWLLDTTGTIQRYDGKRFVALDVPALRTKKPLNLIARTPSGTLLVVGDGGIVLRSGNDGKTWKKIAVNTRVDLSQLALTRFGIMIVGFEGTVLASHDDGRSFAPVATSMTGQLWSIADAGDAVLIGSDDGLVYRLPNRELAVMLHAAYADRDPTLAAVALAVREGAEGGELVLEDALRERGLY